MTGKNFLQFINELTEWTGKLDEAAEKANVWEDNWDDDNVEDDFSDQLRKELQKAGVSTKELETK